MILTSPYAFVRWFLINRVVHSLKEKLAIFQSLKDTIPGIAKELNNHSVIAAEQSFSGLGRLKTYLRSAMGQSRLSRLAL